MKHLNSQSDPNFESRKESFSLRSVPSKFLVVLSFLAVIIIFPGFAKAAEYEAKNQLKRRVRRKVQTSVGNEGVKIGSDILKDNIDYKKLVEEAFNYVPKNNQRTFLPNVHSNLNLRLIITSNDVLRFFSSFFPNMSNISPIIEKVPNPTKIEKLKKVSDYIFLRGGASSFFGVIELLKLSRFLTKKAVQFGKSTLSDFDKEDPHSRLEEKKGSFNLPLQFGNIIASDVNRLIMLSLLIFYATNGKKIPAPLQNLTDRILTKKSKSYWEWSREKMQFALELLFRYPHYILLIVLLYAFRNKTRDALLSDQTVNRVVDFARKQHDSIITMADKIFKSSSDWTHKLYAQMLSTNQRDIDRLYSTEKKIDKLQDELEINKEVLHDLEINHAINTKNLKDCSSQVKQLYNRQQISYDNYQRFISQHQDSTDPLQKNQLGIESNPLLQIQSPDDFNTEKYDVIEFNSDEAFKKAQKDIEEKRNRLGKDK